MDSRFPPDTDKSREWQRGRWLKGYGPIEARNGRADSRPESGSAWMRIHGPIENREAEAMPGAEKAVAPTLTRGRLSAMDSR